MNMELYKNIRHILSGCRTIDDANMFFNLFTINTKEKEIITSVIHTMKYDTPIVDYTIFKKYMNDIYNCKYTEEGYEILNIFMNLSNDPVQIKTMQRIIKTKPNKPYGVSEISLYINKNCPHCNHKCIELRDAGYVICGFSNDGFDWIGCGKDWCFKCNKKLCKSWEENELYLESNRIHTSKCCKKYAHTKKLNYQNDFCMCKSSRNEK